MNRKYIITIVFLILSLFLFPTNFVKGATDIVYTFDDNVLIDSAITSFDDTFNVKNSSYYTEHYNATYSFENDIDFTLPLNWINTSGLGTSVQVINSFDGHSKVIEFNDTSALKNQLTNLFDLNQDGIYEFWFAKDSIVANTDFEINIYEGGTRIIRILFPTDDMTYVSSGTHTIKSNFMIANSFTHFKIELNDTFNTMNVYINNILEGSDLGYEVNSTFGASAIILRSNNADFNYKCYIDAVGYSWSGIYEPFSLVAITQDQGTQSGDLSDSYLDDVNYFTLESSIALKKITAYFQFAEPPPNYDIFADTLSYDVFFSYDMVCPEAKTISLSTDSFGIFDTGTTVDDDRVYLTNVGWIAITMTEITAYEVRVSYLKVELFTSNYTIGNNLFPYLNSTGFKEVDKYEFALKDVNTNNVIGESTYGSWSEADSGGHNTVHIDKDFSDSNNRVVKVDTYNSGDSKVIRKEGITLTNDFINITAGLNMTTFAGTNSYTQVIITASDGVSTIGSLLLRHNGSLEIYDGAGWHIARNDLTSGHFYEFNYFLNYELEHFYVQWFIDGVYDTTHHYPILLTGKNGLETVSFLSKWQSGDSQNTVYLDYCGLYGNGISESDEFGYTSYNTGLNWNTKINNLLYLKANGTFDIGLVEGSYSVGMSMTTFRNLRNYYNELHTINGYDSDTLVNNATFVFTLQNHYFNISTFKIDGVLLKEGVNEYNLEFEHSGVDIDASYFYVSSNRLYFNHIADDTNLEYIQATFDINNVNSTDYAFSFRSYIDNNAYGFVRINYTDTSNIIQLPNILTTTRFLLNQDKIVHDIIILITDKDNNVITGLTTGYIYNFEFLDVLSFGVSVITESLLNMMIPLIIILVPTFLFSSRFGKQVVIPLFMLFSLILTISGIIPYWLFFIIIFPSIIMVFFKSKKEVN